MWQLDNQTPFAAERAWTRDHEGREVWQVVVKATYVFDPAGAIRLAARQAPVHPAAVHRGEPGASSLCYEADFAAEKPKTDIVVNGSAWASAGRPVRQLVAGFSVGGLTKAVRVTGDRIWQQGTFGLVPGEPKPFDRLPLIWERAYGGSQGTDPDTGFPITYPANPVGIGYYDSMAAALHRPLPNIESPDQEVARWSDRPPPAGLGVVASHWSPRRELAGTHDADWQQTRFPLPPADRQPAYWQYAPADQQYPGHLQGGEPVRLVHLHPAGEIRFTLPRLSLRFRTHFSDRPAQAHEARITALILEPDEDRFSLVLQTDLPCQGWEDELLHTRIEGEPPA